MKVAVIGSREINIKNIDRFIPKDMTLLISGGARGVDSLAEKYADKYGIQKLIFKPDYEKYGDQAPLVRNKLIVQNTDIIVAIWNGISKGTQFTIDYARSIGKPVKIFLIDIVGVELMPGNAGKDCKGNGKRGFDVCCDECDYFLCCYGEIYPRQCSDCTDKYCPRKEY